MKTPATAKTVKRKLLLLTIISLLLALALQLYTFGMAANFFSRWFNSFIFFFSLTALTLVAIIPGVAYVVNRFAGK